MQHHWCPVVSIVFISALYLCTTVEAAKLLEANAAKWLREVYSPTYEALDRTDTEALWAMKTNIDDPTLKPKSEETYQQLLNYQLKAAKEANKYLYGVKSFKDPMVERQLRLVSANNFELAEEKDLRKMRQTMIDSYWDTEICSWDSGKQNCGQMWNLDKDTLPMELNNGTDFALMKYIWEESRNKGGLQNKKLFFDYVQLSNKKCKAATYKDCGVYFRLQNLVENRLWYGPLDQLWIEILPLFEQLHTYVRRTLHKRNGLNFTTSAIPPHAWGSVKLLYTLVKPYFYQPDMSTNVTNELTKQGYTALKMYQTVEKYFVSLGFSPLYESFWRLSLLEKPPDRNIDCQNTPALTFGPKEFRVKMCTKRTSADWTIVHKSIFQAMAWKQMENLPIEFKQDRYLSFQRIAEYAMSLQSWSPKYLKSVGLISDDTWTERQQINYLFEMALQTVFVASRYLTAEIWSWKVYDGSSSYEHWNDDWIKLLSKYQGFVPPGVRPIGSFDALQELNRIGFATPLILIVGRLMQFQLLEGLCNTTGHTGPLHLCNLYGSEAAGTKLKNMLSLGASRPWNVAMQVMTGGKYMSVQPLMRFFQPLFNWLKEENTKVQDCFGWNYPWPNDVLSKLEANRCGDKIYS